MPRQGNAAIRHELYVYRSGRSGKKTVEDVEQNLRVFAATARRLKFYEITALTPPEDWEYWRCVSASRKRNIFTMIEKNVEYRQSIARWIFSTARSTYGLYLFWYWHSQPGTTIYYFVIREDDSIESYLFPENPNLSEEQSDRLPSRQRQLFEARTLFPQKAEKISALFYPGADTPDPLRVLLLDRLAWGIIPASTDDYYLKLVRKLWEDHPL